MALGSFDHGRRAADVPDGLPNQGGGARSCPLEGCPGRAGMRTEMRMHFFNRHVRDILIILEEVNLPYPRCPQCDMLVPWRVLNGRHHATAQCKMGAEQKRRRMAEAELRDSMGEPLRPMGNRWRRCQISST